MSTTKVREFRGARGLVYAPVLIDDENEYKTGPVKPFAPVSEISKSVEVSSTTKYYDNVAGLVVSARGADTVTLSTSVLSLETQADISGQIYDETTGTLIDTGKPSDKYFALGYVLGEVGSDGDEEIYVWKLKVQFSFPSETSATKDDGTDSNGQEVECTSINTTHKFTKTNDNCMGISVDVAKGLADTSLFFDEVTTPDTIIAA